MRCGQQARAAPDTLFFRFGRSSREIRDSRLPEAKLMVRFAPRDACAGRSDAPGSEAATRFLEPQWMMGGELGWAVFLGPAPRFLRNKWLALV